LAHALGNPRVEVQPPGSASPPLGVEASEGPEAVSLSPLEVGDEPDEVSVAAEPLAGEEALASPPAALERRAASAAAVGSEVDVWTGIEADDADELDAAEEEEEEEEGDEKPAAGRSGRRTSTYSAPAALGEVSTRASDSHLACGRVLSPK
jgi:hypothetical protein